MKLSLKAGTTSKTCNVFIQDSSSTTGGGLTGLVFNSAGLVAYYALQRAAATSITLATLAAVTSAWSSGGFKEIDATNMPGWYRFDIPDAALASGTFVSIHLKGATNMAPLPIEIELSAWDNQDSVRGGLTALPNAAAEAAGGLYTRGTGAGQINQDANGRVDSNPVAWKGGTIVTPAVTGVPKVDVVDWLGSAVNALIQGKVDSLTSVRAGGAQAGSANSITLDAGASAVNDFYKGSWVVTVAATGAGQTRLCTAYNGTTKVATVAPNWVTAPDGTTGFAIIPAGAIDVELWLGATAPANTGDTYARLGAPAGASVSVDIAAVKSDSAAIKTKTDSLTFTSPGKLDATIQAAGDFAQGAADKVWSSAARTLTAFGFNVTVATNNDKTGYALSAAGLQAIWDEALSLITAPDSIGKLIKDNLDARITSRLYSGNYQDPDNAAAQMAAVAASEAAALCEAILQAAGRSGSLTITERNQIADAILDRVNGVETGLSPRQALRLGAAADAGKLSGAATSTLTIRNFADTKDRIVATVDSSGNRLNIVVDLT